MRNLETHTFLANLHVAEREMDNIVALVQH